MEKRMLTRCLGSLAASVLLALGTANAAPDAGSWQSAQIVAFNDFDDLEVKLDGKPAKAFLVGLRPIREAIKDMPQQQRARESALAALSKAELFAQVVTRRGEAVGLSIDAFSHRKHGFDHPWDPEKHPYCWTGWGAYNFNTYFLHAGTTKYLDNFGDNRPWRERFARAIGEVEGNEHGAIAPPAGEPSALVCRLLLIRQHGQATLKHTDKRWLQVASARLQCVSQSCNPSVAEQSHRLEKALVDIG
jgi:hypothetical protein